jgi:tRNA (guanine-N7-)-methyltransferase
VSEFWLGVFGNDRPVEVEIGPGRGDVLVAFAAAHPDTNYLAIEHARGAADRLAAALAGRELANVRVVAGDARCIVRELVPTASVAAYHAYFPDPWPKRRHWRRRLFNAGFTDELRRTLAPGGRVHVATDVAALFDDMCAALDAAGFARAGTAPPRPPTRFERKYAVAGTYAASFTRAA